MTDSDRSIPVAQRLVHQHLVVLGCRRLRPASNRERDEGRANKEGCNGQEPDEDGRSAGAGLGAFTGRLSSVRKRSTGGGGAGLASMATGIGGSAGGLGIATTRACGGGDGGTG